MVRTPFHGRNIPSTLSRPKPGAATAPELRIHGIHRDADEPALESIGLSDLMDGLDGLQESVVDQIIVLGVRTKKLENDAVHIQCITIVKSRGERRCPGASQIQEFCLRLSPRQDFQDVSIGNLPLLLFCYGHQVHQLQWTDAEPHRNGSPEIIYVTGLSIMRICLRSLLLLSLSGASTACEPRVQVVDQDNSRRPLAGSRYAAVVLGTPNLTAFFRFSEKEGSRVLDRVGGQELLVEPGVSLDEAGALPGDPEDSSIFFRSGQPDHVAGINPEGWNFRVALTVEFWLRLRGVGDGACRQNTEGLTKLLWVDGQEPGHFGAWGVHLQDSFPTRLGFHVQIDADGTGRELQASEAWTGPGLLDLPDDPGCGDASWQHIAITYDARKTPNVHIYLDGRPSVESDDAAITPHAEPAGGIGGYTPQARLHVGGIGLQPKVPYEYPVADGLTLDGWIDELALYDRALTAEEVNNHVEAATDTSR